MNKKKKDWEEPIYFGNHKGFIKNTYILEINLKTEAEHAFTLLITLDKVISIIGTVMATMKI